MTKTVMQGSCDGCYRIVPLYTLTYCADSHKMLCRDCYEQTRTEITYEDTHKVISKMKLILEKKEKS